MNLFKVLKGGNSSIREVNMTAILGYFLDEYQDHALGNQLLFELISMIEEVPDNIVKNYRTETWIESENIDTVVKFFRHNDGIEEEFHRIIIENKVQNTAADEMQLVRYYNLQREDNDFPITVLFITHENPSQKTLNEFENLTVQGNDRKKHIFWYESNNEDSQGSIHQLLLNLITKEYKAEIDPIHGYILQTIKAFARHLESYSSTTRVSGPSDELLRRDSYKILDMLERQQLELGSFLYRGEIVNSDNEIDSTSDLRFPRFYYNLPNTDFRVSLQYSNRENPQARILLRPINNNTQGKESVRNLCNFVNIANDVLLFKKNGEYANIVEEREGKLIDNASRRLSEWTPLEMKRVIEQYINIVETLQG